MMESCPSILNTSQAELEQFWQEHVNLKQESGLSQAAYCRKHNLVCSRFSYWEKKLSSPVSKLLPVKLEDAVVKADALCTLLLKSGHELKIHDLSVMPMLLSVLS